MTDGKARQPWVPGEERGWALGARFFPNVWWEGIGSEAESWGPGLALWSAHRVSIKSLYGLTYSPQTLIPLHIHCNLPTTHLPVGVPS